jgi:hypothetical protein
MAKQDDYTRYTIRVPSDLYGRLQRAAGDASVNAEIIRRLDESFDQENRHSELMVLIAKGDALSNVYRKQVDLLEALLALVVDTAGDRLPDEMQELLRGSRSAPSDYYNKLIRQMDGASKDPKSSTEIEANALEQDVLAIVELMDTELRGDQIGEVPKLRTSLGDRLSRAVGDRTVAAMKIAVEKLREAGLLKGDERAASEAVDATQLFKKRA